MFKNKIFGFSKQLKKFNLIKTMLTGYQKRNLTSFFRKPYKALPNFNFNFFNHNRKFIKNGSLQKKISYKPNNAFNETANHSEEIYAEQIRQVIIGMQDRKVEVGTAYVNSTANLNGHAYGIFEKLPRGFIDTNIFMNGTFSNFVGKQSTILEELNQTDKLVRFGTGDTVTLRPNKFTIKGHGFTATGWLATTEPQHALNGYLIHIFVSTASGDNYMIRLGCGRYPVPIFNVLVDGLNPYLGAKAWQLTDFLMLLESFGEQYVIENLKDAQPELLNAVLSLRDENSYAWAKRKQESFLGMGDEVHLGSQYGSDGYISNMITNTGVASQVLQRVMLYANSYFDFGREEK